MPELTPVLPQLQRQQPNWVPSGHGDTGLLTFPGWRRMQKAVVELLHLLITFGREFANQYPDLHQYSGEPLDLSVCRFLSVAIG